MARTPETPDGSWPITKDDKVEIQALGRELVKFFQGYFKDRDTVHIKILAGSFQYVMELQSQKAKVLGDDFVIAQRAITQYSLAEKIEEPFTLPVEQSIDEQIDAAEKNLAALKERKAVESPEGEEVAEASPAPSASALPEAPAPEAPAAPAA